MAFVAGSLGAIQSAWSATLTWSSTAADTNWNDPSNWGGTVPGAADVGQFAAASYTSQPSLSTTAAIGGIWDTGSGAVTIGGTTLSIASATINGNAGTGIELDAGAGPLTINAPLDLTNAQTWISNSLNAITVNGNMVAGSLTETGSGVVALLGSNTFGGSLTINGGTLQVPGGTDSGISNLYLGRSGGNGTFSFGGGSLAVTSEYVGFSGTGAFTQSGGTHVITNFLALAQNSGSGSYTLTGGSLLSANSETIGQAGSASFTQSGGTNASTNIYLGRNAGALGTYDLSASGLFSAQSVSIGYSGTGAFVHTGGVSTVSNLILGDQAGGIGTYNLSSSGLLSSGTETIGNSGTGAFTQSGGTNTLTSALYLGQYAGSSGMYTLSGGLLVAPSIVQGAGTGIVNVSGGTLTSQSGNLTISTSGGVLTVAGQISGSTGLTKTGSSTLILAGANTYTGNTSISQGTLDLGNANAVQSSTVLVNVNNGLQFLSSIGSFNVGAIGGSGGLVLADTGGNPIALVTGGNNASTTYSGFISGAGTLVHNGSGTMTLTGTNTYSGGTVLGPDDLVITNGQALGLGPLTFTGNAAVTTSGNMSVANSFVLQSGVTGALDTTGTTTVSGPISGAGSLSKLGSGTLVLSGSNTFSGPTLLNQGTLVLANGAALENSDVVISPDAVLQISPALGFLGGMLGQLSGAGTVLLSGGSQTLIVGLGNANSNTYSGTIQGSGTLEWAGSGTLYLTGSNTWTGGTILDPGILAIQSDAALGAVPPSPAANIVFRNNSTLQARSSFALNANRNISISASTTGSFDPYGGTFTIGGVISGSGALAVVGSGTLVLTNTETYTGGTIIDSGTLQLGSGGTAGSVAGSIVDNSVVVFNRSDSTSYAGGISGAGGLQQAGPGTLLLGGNNSFSGNTIVAAGVLQLGNSTALQTSTVVVSGGTLDLNGFAAILGGLAGSGNLALGSGTVTVGGNGSQTIYSGSLSGAANLVKAGSGQLTLTGSSSYTGGTTLNQGVLAIGSDAALGTVTGQSSNNINFTGNSTLRSLASFALPSSRGISIAASTTGSFDPDGNTLIIGGAIGGPGALAVAGTGTLVLTNSETYTGGTTVSAGTLQLGDGGTTGSIIGAIADNGMLVFDLSTSTTFTAGISGTGSVRQASNSTLLIGGPNSFTGDMIVSAGVLKLASSNALQSCTVFTSGGSLDLNGFYATFGGLAGSGNLSLGGGTLTVGGNNSSTTYAGSLSGPAALLKTGTGLFVLSGSNSYSGLTTISGGVLEAATTSSVPGLVPFSAGSVSMHGGILAVGVGGAMQWSTGSIDQLLTTQLFSSSGTLGIDTSAANFTLTGAGLSTAGLTLLKLGPNTLTLSGTNTYTGSTLVSGGALELTSTNALSSVFTPGKVDVESGATLTLAVGGSRQWISTSIYNLLQVSGLFSPGSSLGLDTNGGSFTLGSINNSSIGLSVTGSNRLTLTGSNAFSGTTNIGQGTLQLANSAALVDSTVAINSDNGLQFSPGIGTFDLGGISGSSALQEVDTGGGSVNLVVGGDGAPTTFGGCISGSGSLTKIGSGDLVLAGTDTFSGGILVDAGTLTLLGVDSIPDGSSITVGADGGAVFTCNVLPVPSLARLTSDASLLSAEPPSQMQAVPEPGTFVLFSFALALFGAARGLCRSW
ncbi:MAG: beta strand repeat-containing protein [Thermoguttaceae bacterium]